MTPEEKRRKLMRQLPPTKGQYWMHLGRREDGRFDVEARVDLRDNPDIADRLRALPGKGRFRKERMALPHGPSIKRPTEAEARRFFLEGVAVHFLGGHCVGAAPGAEAEMAALIRDAVADTDMPLSGTLPNGRKITQEEGRDMLLRAASIIEDRGFVSVYDKGLEGYTVKDEDAGAEDYHITSSARAFHESRNALALNTFAKDPRTPWPAAGFKKGGGSVMLRALTPDEEMQYSPEQVETAVRIMWEQQSRLSAVDADTLDAVCILYLEKNPKVGERVAIRVDDILELRGIKKKSRGQGRRSTYEPEQRQQVAASIARIEKIWAEVAEAPPGAGTKDKGYRLESRLFTSDARIVQGNLFDGTEEVYAFSVRPGLVLEPFLHGEGRQVMMQSRKALEYSAQKQVHHKCLTRFFSYQWRTDAKNANRQRGFLVRTLLDAMGKGMAQKPGDTKDALENVLDTLQEDGVIAGWHYRAWDDATAPRKGWADLWLDETILIEMPAALFQHYHDNIALPRAEKVKPAKKPSRPRQGTPTAATEAPAPLADRIREKRERIGRTRAEAAAQIGIPAKTLEKIENGETTRPHRRTLEAVEAWLER